MQKPLLQRQGAPVPPQVLQPRKRSPHNVWAVDCGWMRQSQCVELLGLTPSELQHWSTRDVQGRTEFSDIQVKTRREAFSKRDVLAGAIVSFLGTFLTEVTGEHHIWVSVNLSHSRAQTKLFLVVFPYKWPILAHASDLKNLPHKQHLALACSVPLTKWPQAQH